MIRVASSPKVFTRPPPPSVEPPKTSPPASIVIDDLMLPPTEAPPSIPVPRPVLPEGEDDQVTNGAAHSPPSPNSRPARTLPAPPGNQENGEVSSNTSLASSNGAPQKPSVSPRAIARPPPPPISDLPPPTSEHEEEAVEDSPTSHEGDETPLSPNSATGTEEIKAGRRMPTRPPALTKTNRTVNLPHQRAQSHNVESSGFIKPHTPPPGSLPRPPTGILENPPTISAEDFAWNGQRSISLSTIPTSAETSSTDGTASRPAPPRSFANSTNASFAKRSQSIAGRDGAAQLFRSQSQPTGLQGANGGTSNPRDSAAIVLKLGIQTAAEETPDLLKQRANLADEILKTEAVYLEDLRLIVAKFLIPFRTNMKFMSATDAGKLFLNIESLELISEEIHGAMKEAFEQAESSAHVSLAPVYLQYTETMLQGFSLYCAGHSDSLSLLTRLRKKQAGFTTYLEQLEADEALNKLRLADFLTRPIQHICRQPLLLRELLKSTPQTHPDYEDLIFALDQINDLVDRVNSNAKEVGNIQAITNVENSVAMLPEGLKLLMPGRYMLREGRFLRHSGKTGKAPAEHYLFLFSDMLILTKPRAFNDTEYVFTELIPLHQVHIEEAAETDQIKNAFSVTSLLTLRSHIFVAKDEKKNNEVIKRDWLNAISTTKARFERGLAGISSPDDESLGIAFKVQSNASTGYDNPYEAMRDQMSSVSVQQRITGWRGESVLREIWSQSNRPAEAFVMPLIIKFHMEAPASIRVTLADDEEMIENEGAVFVFDEFLVIASEKKDVQVKKPYDWIASVIYDSCVLANSDTPIQEKKIMSGRTVYPLTLISASTRKKFVLYFRSDTVKNNMYNTLSSKMPAFMDNGAASGVSMSVSSLAAAKKDKSNSGDADEKGTLRTKKNIFGRKLGYRTVSQSTNSSEGSGGSGGASGSNTPTSGPMSPPMSAEARKDRTQSSSVATIIATQGMPTPFLASSSSAGNLHSPTTSPASFEVDDDNEPEKLLTADGFEVPPWAPDDSSNNCLGCNAKFTTTNRRHHCRNCGQLFCKKCTTKKCFLPRFGFTQKKMKVCERCFLKH